MHFKSVKPLRKAKKVCAVYKPQTVKDIDNLSLVAKKADITVIDWQINLDDSVGINEKNGEEDAEDDDPRGPHTLKIIREVLLDLSTGSRSLKLILIYTGESGLYDITDVIFDDLTKFGLSNVQKGDCEVFSDNMKILVVAKPAFEGNGSKSKFKYNPKLNKKIVSYADLPNFILSEFTKLTSGLLSNFVLRSLTVLRENTFRLIDLYKKDLDPSFLSHRLLLPNPDDSKEQLIEILSHSIQALLNYNKSGETVSVDNIKKWIDTRKFTKSISISNKELKVDTSFIKEWASNGFRKACELKWTASGHGDVTDTQKEKFEKKERELHKDGSRLIRMDGEDEGIDSQFSILTHHKSNLRQPSFVPKMSLGTLIKEEGKDRYYLCIQARCDSVRVLKERKFLFLPLETVADSKSKFHFVVEDNGTTVLLKIIKEAFELKTIKFKPSPKSETVLASSENDHYYFSSNWEEKFIWLADLKDAHAQRVANNFATQLSRVGLDESEWLRRWSTN